MSTVASVREVPILFSGTMVRALLEGRKSQTRRVVTDATSRGNFRASCLQLDDPRTFPDQGPSPAGNPGWYLHAPVDAEACARRHGGQPSEWDGSAIERLYPRWFPGDRMWVRETWARGGGDWVYAADNNASPPRWRPSIHMPRAASRLTLDVELVRVQRVQEITEGDALAEGIREKFAGCFTSGDALSGTTARECFRRRWDALNARRGYGWEANPWVWAITFRVLSGGGAEAPR